MSRGCCQLYCERFAEQGFYLDHFIFNVVFCGCYGGNTTAFVHRGLQNQQNMKVSCSSFKENVAYDVAKKEEKMSYFVFSFWQGIEYFFLILVLYQSLKFCYCDSPNSKSQAGKE